MGLAMLDLSRTRADEWYERGLIHSWARSNVPGRLLALCSAVFAGGNRYEPKLSAAGNSSSVNSMRLFMFESDVLLEACALSPLSTQSTICAETFAEVWPP